MRWTGFTVSILVLFTQAVSAQLAVNKCKFLGNVVGSSVPPSFDQYWNQITPENSGKWGEAEPQRDAMNWAPLDAAYNHAIAKGYPFKQHTFIWEQQKPGWLAGLSAAEQLEEIEEWMQEFCSRYPDTDMIEVVNEPVNAPPTFASALGGAGSTGYDWVIKAFELARNYCPDAKLLINEYNILNGYTSTQSYLQIINLLKDRDLIDGIGLQGHSIEETTASELKSRLDAMATAGLPLYITEYDVRGTNSKQLDIYRKQFPVMWAHPAVKGITLWGYIQGQMWRDEAHLLTSGGTERPALVWLKEFVGSTPDQPFCDLVTGVEREESVLKVYPNPVVDGTVRIERTEGIGTVKIIDPLGRVLVSTDARGETAITVNFTGAAPGLYIVSVTNFSQTVTRKFLIP
ncbi:MAG TPA: endo-1,4-beta-xylanase [Cyclobacteriaceae bacterium]|jgi:endo-1,4-beta-xylanase